MGSLACLLQETRTPMRKYLYGIGQGVLLLALVGLGLLAVFSILEVLSSFNWE